MIGPARACVHSPAPRVVVAMFAQGGKTSTAFNVIGSKLDSRPRPMMYVAATQDQVLRVIEPKIDEMLRNCPSLWAKTLKGKKYSAVRKIISGVPLRLAWPTPSQMSSDAVALVVVDEIDRIARDIRGEGGIMELADARHSTYDDGKTLGFSTPTEGNVEVYVDERTGLEHWRKVAPDQVRSPVWQLWQEGTRFEWAWPCPSCREYFVPRFKWLKFDSKGSLADVRRSAHVECPHCAHAIKSTDKTWCNQRGVYVAPGQRPKRYHHAQTRATIRDHTRATVVEVRVDFGDATLPAAYAGEDATFWVSGLANFSAKKTFGFLAVEHQKAARSGSLEKVRGVINLQFGETFAFGGDAPKWEEVAARKGPYMLGQVPGGVRRLFLTVDVQKNRLEWVIRGWGLNEESWLIDTGELWVPDGLGIETGEIWADLRELLETPYGGKAIDRVAIDSGYKPDPVYRFAALDRRRRYATKGDSRTKLFYGQPMDVNRKGKTKRRGSVILWHVDSDRCKQWVHSRMALTAEDAGQWHIAADTPEDYCRQIVAEERVDAPSGKTLWIQTGPNHKLDCEALQYFLASKEKLLIRRGKPAEEPPPDSAAEVDDMSDEPSDDTQMSAKRPSSVRRRRGSWARSWRR